MTMQTSTTPPPRRTTPERSVAAGPGQDSEITWLLHRAAQRMRTVTGEQAERYGIQLRDHIVLSALHKTPELTQIELGRTLGLDKTTLMSQLDRLERAGLIERQHDPRDRRRRVPVITAQGETLRAAVAKDAERAEQGAVQQFNYEQIATLRQMLFAIIGTNEDPGSCL